VCKNAFDIRLFHGSLAHLGGYFCHGVPNKLSSYLISKSDLTLTVQIALKNACSEIPSNFSA